MSFDIKVSRPRKLGSCPSRQLRSCADRSKTGRVPKCAHVSDTACHPYG